MKRTRRIIYNDDGGAGRVSPVPIHSVEEFLARRAVPLIGTHVDTISFCTTAGTFGRFYHRTEVGEIADDRRGRYANSIIPDLVRRGTDPLQVMIEFCREQGLENWWSLRMNDTHDAGNPLLISALKEQHPEYLLGAPDHQPVWGAWSAASYNQPRIRDLAVAFVEEVLERYDVDGVELDFFRHPVFFESSARGEYARDDELRAMSGVVKRIRGAVDRAARTRDRELTLAMVVPDSVEYCGRIGLDLQGWLAAGIADVLLPTGYFRLNPWSRAVALGRDHGLSVYPCLQEPRLGDEQGKALRSSVEAYRARALNVLGAGADGVCVYNLFTLGSHGKLMREMGDREALERSPRLHFPSFRGIGRPAGRPVSYRDLMAIPTIGPDHPQVVEPGEAVRVVVHAAPPTDDGSVIVNARLGRAAGAAIRVLCNGRSAEDREPVADPPIAGVAETPAESAWVQCTFPSSVLASGTAEIEISSPGGERVLVEDLFVSVGLAG